MASDVRTVKLAHEDRLMEVPGVLGVAAGRDGERDAILLLVRTLEPENASPGRLGLPDQLEGFPLVVREIGDLAAQ